MGKVKVGFIPAHRDLMDEQYAKGIRDIIVDKLNHMDGIELIVPDEVHTKNGLVRSEEDAQKTISLFSIESDIKLFYYFHSVINLIHYSISIFTSMLFFKPNVVYFTISPVNLFYRDLVYVFILKLFKPAIVYHLHRDGMDSIGTGNKRS